MATVFVTGATGVLGRGTVERLLQEGHRVRALARAAGALLRSQRVSNAALRNGAGWAPVIASAVDGWAAVAATRRGASHV
jgi:uncharacterized protein YbjT (DUF2867 family)